MLSFVPIWAGRIGHASYIETVGCAPELLLSQYKSANPPGQVYLELQVGIVSRRKKLKKWAQIKIVYILLLLIESFTDLY